MLRSMLIGGALLLVLGCSSGSEEPTIPATQEEEPLANLFEEVSMSPEITALDIRNARQVSPQLLTGGQLSKEQMAKLTELGYRTFINLRLVDEGGTGWEEEYAKAEGLTFHRLPVNGARGITRGNAERLARYLDEAGDDPVAVYCASGNRVGALFALKVHYLDGLNVEEAISYGTKAGMTRLEPIVRSRLSVE